MPIIDIQFVQAAFMSLFLFMFSLFIKEYFNSFGDFPVSVFTCVSLALNMFKSYKIIVFD